MVLKKTLEYRILSSNISNYYESEYQLCHFIKGKKRILNKIRLITVFDGRTLTKKSEENKEDLIKEIY